MNENQGFLLSLLTWYQSQGRKPNSFLFPVSSTPGNLPMTVFHSGHLSHPLKLSGRSNRRQKTFTVGDFSGDVFFRHRPHRKERLEEISNLSQSTGTRNPSTRLTRAFFRPATAREGAWATFRQRASSSSLAWCWLATLHTCFCHSSPARASFGVLLPPLALRTVFPASSDYFFSTPIPTRALGSVLLPFRWCHSCFFFSIWSLTRAILRFFLLQPHLKPY